MSELDELKKQTKLLQWLVRHQMRMANIHFKEKDVTDVSK